MAGLDPLSRGISQGASFDPRISEISIPAAEVAALRSTLGTGDIVSAKVLPPSGGADFVEINGQKLAAALPSNVRPGDTMIIEVVAFEGDRLYVRNLGVDVSTGSTADASSRTGPMFVPDLSDELSPATYSPRSVSGAPLPLVQPGGTQEAPAPEQPSMPGSPGGGAYAPPAAAVTRPAGTPVYFIATAGGGSSASSAPGVAYNPPAARPAASSSAGGANAPSSTAATVVARPPQLPGGAPPAAVLVAATVKQSGLGAGPSAGAPSVARTSPALESGLDPRSPVEAKIAASRATASAPGETSVSARDSAAQASARLAPAARQAANAGSALLRQSTTESEAAGQIAQRALVVPRAVAALAAAEVAAALEAAIDEATAPGTGAAESDSGGASAQTDAGGASGATTTSATAASTATTASAPTGTAGAAAPAGTTGAAGATAASGGATASSPATAATPGSPKPVSTAVAYAEPSALVRALNLPVTPTNVGAARLALARPEFLPEALSALERALPDGAADPRVSSLKAIAAYVTRLDPASPHFAQQLAAYVEHVVEGPEARLVALLDTLANAAGEPGAAGESAPSPAPGGAGASTTGAPVTAQGAAASATPASTTPGSAAQGASAGDATRAGDGGAALEDVFKTPQLPLNAGTAAQASIVERAVALAHDLKTQLQSFVEAPPAGSSSTAVAAAQTALTAVSANQVNAALVAQQNPAQIALSVPLPFTGGRPAQITIARDAPQGGRALDGDNFHIGFILDTKYLGTVALDLQTVGRTVNVKLQAESELYAGTFSRSLGELGTRLKTLRYNVAAMQAGVAPRGRAPVETASAPAAGSASGSAAPAEPVAAAGALDKHV